MLALSGHFIRIYLRNWSGCQISNFFVSCLISFPKAFSQELFSSTIKSIASGTNPGKSGELEITDFHMQTYDYISVLLELTLFIFSGAGYYS